MSGLDSQSTPNASTPNASPGSSGEALFHLAKMSGTGSSFGQADYVAISPVAICALLLALASLFSLVFTLFVISAGASIFLGVLSIIIIRRSNGTQGGIFIALAGILLSLLVGGGVLAQQARAWSEERAYTRKCAEVIARFGDEVKAGDYDRAYNSLMTESFRKKFNAKIFKGLFEFIQNNPKGNKLLTYEFDNQPIQFEPVADSDAKVGRTLAISRFAVRGEDREAFILNNVDGEWKIDSLPRLFVIRKPRRPGEEAPQQ